MVVFISLPSRLGGESCAAAYIRDMAHQERGKHVGITCRFKRTV